METHSDMLAHMQDAMQTMVEEHNELREQYAHMVDTAHNNNRGPPSVVATTSTSSNTGTSSNSANTAVPQMSYNDIQEMIKQALQSVTPAGNTPTTSSNLQHQQETPPWLVTHNNTKVTHNNTIDPRSGDSGGHGVIHVVLL